MPHWKDFEPFVVRGRNKDEKLRLTVSREFVDTHFEKNHLTPIFQLSSHLYGRLPEINLIEMVAAASPTTELTTLEDSIALFEGIKRPHDDEDNGDSVLVYVLRPAVTIEYCKSMTCQARAAVPPKSSVLTALVRTNLALLEDYDELDGIVTRLEWVFADAEENLPRKAEMRYEKRHW